MFTDESRFTLRHADGRLRVYRRVGKRYADACVLRHDRFGGGSVMFWGGIVGNRRTDLVRVDGNLNTQVYRYHILTPHMLPFMQANPGMTFQQDNARPHVARVNMAFLDQHNINVLPWSSLSPDLSSIEHVWDQLGRQVRRLRNLRQTLPELTQALQEEWQNIPMPRINWMIASMRRRCQAVVNGNGLITRY